MASISELKRIKPFTNFQEGCVNVFIFPVMDGLASHILKRLMYRLETVDTPSYVLIEDKGVVVEKDIQTGVYIHEDKDKTRARVVMERYGRAFRTPVVNTTKLRTEFLYMNERKKNIIYVVTGTGADRMKPNDAARMTEGKQGNVYLLNAFYNGKSVEITQRIASDGRLYGKKSENLVRNTGFSVTEQYVRNATAGQLVFNILNTVLTKGMDINYSGLSGEMKTGGMEKTYLKGRIAGSILDRVDKTGMLPDSKILDAFDEDFVEFEKSVGERVREKAFSPVGLVDINRIKGYAELVANLKCEREIELNVKWAQDSLKLLLQIFSEKGKRKKEDIYLLAILIAYIENKNGSIWTA